MEKETILEQFEDYPVIAAVKDEDGLKNVWNQGRKYRLYLCFMETSAISGIL